MNEPPVHLAPEARIKWVEILPILEARGEIEQGSLDALVLYCTAWSQWGEAEEKVKDLGTVVKSPAGFPVENPYSVIARKAQTEFRRWAAELKLTPKSAGKERKSRTAEQPPTVENPLQNLRLHIG
jgi:P27 family predicted phage terminase small subunit